MSIAQKIRQDLRRLFHGADPLIFVQDARIVTMREATFCDVRLRVPTAVEAAYHIYTMGDWGCAGVPKAPEKEPPKPAQSVEWKKHEPMPVDALKPERVIFSGPKTIVFWLDGTKTIVSLMDGEEHDEYAAFCAAVVKKMFGQTHKAKKFLNSIKVVQEPKSKKKTKEVTSDEA